MIAAGELRDHRAVQPGVLVELAVQRLRWHPVGQLLGPLEVLDPDEGVVEERVADPVPLQAGGEPVVTVQAELDTEGRPSGHAQVAEPELGVDEVEVVVQTPAAVGLEKQKIVGERGSHPGLVHIFSAMERCSSFKPLHDKPSERLDVADELDRQAVLGAHTLGVVADRLTQRLGEGGVVEDPDVALAQLPRHRLSMRDIGQRSLDEDAVEARDHATDGASLAFGQHGSARQESSILSSRLPGPPASRSALVPAMPV